MSTYASVDENQDLLASKARSSSDEPRARHPWRSAILGFFLTFLLILLILFFAVGFSTKRPLLGPLFVASIGPSLLILWLATWKESDPAWRERDKTPLELTILGLILGILVTILVGIVGTVINSVMEGTMNGGMSFVGLFFFQALQAFILTAVVEETSKYVCTLVATTSSMRPYIRHPYTIVLFGLAAALGFAGLENVAYVLGEGVEAGWYLALIRALLAVPLHGTTGCLIGAGLARRVFFQEKNNYFTVILWPVLIHGMYDFIWMAPFRSGPFEGPKHGLANEKNTVDLGDWLALWYLSNIVLVVMGLWYAYSSADKVCVEYEDRSKLSENSKATV